MIYLTSLLQLNSVSKIDWKSTYAANNCCKQRCCIAPSEFLPYDPFPGSTPYFQEGNGFFQYRYTKEHAKYLYDVAENCTIDFSTSYAQSVERDTDYIESCEQFYGRAAMWYNRSVLTWDEIDQRLVQDAFHRSMFNATGDSMRYAVASAATGLRILPQAAALAEITARNVLKGYESEGDLGWLTLFYDGIMTQETGDTNNNFIGQIPQHLFTGYGQAKTALDIYANMSAVSGMLQEEIAHTKGQLQFYAAFYLFTLYEWYGVVPLIREFSGGRPVFAYPSSKGKVLAEAKVHSAMAVQMMRDDIPASSVVTKAYANPAAAKLLHAKILMHEKSFESAHALLEEIVSSGKYQLVSDFQDIWEHEGEFGQESILEYDFDERALAWWDWGWVYGGQNQAVIWYGIRGFSKHGFDQGWSAFVPTQATVDKFQISDARRNATIYDLNYLAAVNGWTEGDDYFKGYDHTGYFNKKYMGRSGRYVGGQRELMYGNNHRIFRYAEVLLLSAECAYMTNDEDLARIRVNQIRTRANLPTIDYNGTHLFDEIKKQGELEFMLEGKTLFHEMRRSGTLGIEVGKDRFPIPQSFINKFHKRLSQPYDYFLSPSPPPTPPPPPSSPPEPPSPPQSPIGYTIPDWLVGNWTLKPSAGSTQVGMGASMWWRNSDSDVNLRPCLHDDKYVFESDGTFRNVLDNNTWVELAGTGADGRCASPENSPYLLSMSRSETGTFQYSNTTNTIAVTNGFLGFFWVNNGFYYTYIGGNESNIPIDNKITYAVESFSDTEMTVNITYTSNSDWGVMYPYWKFKFVKEGMWTPSDASAATCPDSNTWYGFSSVNDDTWATCTAWKNAFNGNCDAAINAGASPDNIRQAKIHCRTACGMTTDSTTWHGFSTESDEWATCALWKNTFNGNCDAALGNGANATIVELAKLNCPNACCLPPSAPPPPSPPFAPMTAVNLVGDWQLDNATAGAMSIGPTKGDGLWWSSSAEDIVTRSCFFDDIYRFGADGIFENVLGGQTWVEKWQNETEGCGTPVAPHDGSNPARYWVENRTLTIQGLGAYLGLSKVHNTGEDGNPQNNMITYMLSYLTENMMVLDINIPNAWWRFKFKKVPGLSS